MKAIIKRVNHEPQEIDIYKMTCKNGVVTINDNVQFRFGEEVEYIAIEEKEGDK